jgi:hypothetical protein
VQPLRQPCAEGRCPLLGRGAPSLRAEQQRRRRVVRVGGASGSERHLRGGRAAAPPPTRGSSGCVGSSTGDACEFRKWHGRRGTQASHLHQYLIEGLRHGRARVGDAQKRLALLEDRMYECTCRSKKQAWCGLFLAHPRAAAGCRHGDRWARLRLFAHAEAPTSACATTGTMVVSACCSNCARSGAAVSGRAARRSSSQPRSRAASAAEKKSGQSRLGVEKGPATTRRTSIHRPGALWSLGAHQVALARPSRAQGRLKAKVAGINC